MTGTEQTAWRYPEALVETDWLAANLDDPNLRIYDCTTYLRAPGDNLDVPYIVESGRADFDAAHIPGAGFLDLQSELSDNANPLRFTMPAPDVLAAAFAAKGIGDDTRVILYSRGAMQWSTRIWWMLRAIGFDNAAILNGGWEKWADEGRPESTRAPDHAPAMLTANPRDGLFVGKDAVMAAIGSESICTLNALSAELHSGAGERYGRPGRIPGSVNVPAASLADTASRALLSPQAVQQAFTAVGAAPDKKIITYCGGGIAASLDAYLLHQLGYTDIAIYDASLSEWAPDPDLPMETD
ncbi:MAG: sulfurtransferase [Rhodospirillaceae bacterium]|jgi:thiosulfate/3-mercaptopyruvate sulfurtransferase|nr:sulfurtransferase [Rhodospirillaceae bacterium]MBT5667514.1 sulfurtransferase [Rhodospirillaceae bacterium]MBT5810156.1 sulfurtransferase [Rhodospirillaceae bacterium]